MRIDPNSIYLVDSGGQYLDGTTDVTRTIWVGPGEPTAEMKDRYTRVLKGHIALALARLPGRHARRHSSIHWLARRIWGRQGSITRMAPAMAWAASLPCTKARNASANSPADRPERMSRCRRA